MLSACSCNAYSVLSLVSGEVLARTEQAGGGKGGRGGGGGGGRLYVNAVQSPPE